MQLFLGNLHFFCLRKLLPVYSLCFPSSSSSSDSGDPGAVKACKKQTGSHPFCQRRAQKLNLLLRERKSEPACVCFIVPGLFIGYTYAMAPRLLLDHPDWSPFRCMRESRLLMKGHKKDFFVLRLTLIGWNIMALFPLAAVFARPYSTLCETEFYLELTGTNVPEIFEDESEEKPPWEY